MWKLSFIKLSLLASFLVFSCGFATAQTSEFTYQGKLTDTGTPSATYDFEFRLCASAFSCAPPLETKLHQAVAVTNGSFAVTLNFDAAHFSGADRFLEIAVRRTSNDPWTTLLPRQKISSAPYSIRSLNATTADNSLRLGGTLANQFVQTSDARLSDARNPSPNSPNYIQNTTSQQPSSNFNISGSGLAGGTLSASFINAATQYNIDGFRILSAPTGTDNLYAGFAAGNAPGVGTRNSAFGYYAGESANSGGDNSFFGHFSGRNTVGSRNSFFGSSAGLNTAGGNDNTFTGSNAGLGNTTGSNNTLLGAEANVLSPDLTFATAIGAGATVNLNNQIVLGRSNGQDEVLMPGNTYITGDFSAATVTTSALTVNGILSGSVLNAATQFNLGGNRILSSPGFLNLFAGIGAGGANSGSENSFFGYHAGLNNTTGFQNAFFGGQAGRNNTIGLGNAFFGNVAGLSNTTGNSNAFFGGGASNSNTTGSNNSTFGGDAGNNNTTGSNNLFLGNHSGGSNTVENNNSFIGASSNGVAGITNSTALGYRARVTQSNSLVLGSINGVNGADADTRVGIGTTAPFGKLQVVTANDAAPGIISAWDSRHFVIGGASNSGGIGMSYDQTNNVGYIHSLSPNVLWRNLVLQAGGGNVGIGTTAPQARLHVGDGALLLDNNQGLFLKDTAGTQKRALIGDSSNILRFGSGGPTGFDEIRFDVSTSGEAMTIKGNGNVGIGTISPSAKLHVESAGLNKFMVGSAAAPKFLVRDDFVNIGASGFYPDPGLRLVVGGIIQTQVATGGFVPLCWSAQEYIATCSSSLRYKENIHDFSSGLDLLRRLRPVSFNWKANATADLGLIAEEVNEIEPRLIIHNKQGEIEGVKYDRVSVILINAVKEQQAQIESKQEQIQKQQTQIESQQKQIEEQRKLIESQQQQTDALKRLVCESKPEAAICKEK